MTLALFDLDNTLIAGDSDHAWGEFIVEKGLVDAQHYKAMNDKFYDDYQNGGLDCEAYLRFAFEPLSKIPMAELNSLHQEFMANRLAQMWLPRAVELVEKHRSQGHRLLVITATGRFVVEPIVRKFGISDILCSEPEVRDGRYTGELVEEPCFSEGKVTKLERWLQEQDEGLAGAWFYSDSFNDIPLLDKVDNPVAVDPDAKLKAHAEASGWPMISLR